MVNNIFSTTTNKCSYKSLFNSGRSKNNCYIHYVYSLTIVMTSFQSWLWLKSW